MANPQVEDGHVDLAHEIIENFYRLQLSGNEWRILWVIIRQTYGWKKKADRISISFFQKKTGLKRRHVSRAIKDLVERNIVTKNDTSFITTYGFQKDYIKWELSPKKTPITKNDTKAVTKIGAHKRNSKETIYTRENFDLFYRAYPKRKARRDAQRAWTKLNPDESLVYAILTALEKQKSSLDWKKDGGQYIPLPATWLNGRRWEDEIEGPPAGDRWA
jgi:phage replication O-like protein O